MLNDLLTLQNRKEIYDLVSKNPGLHLRELSRRTNTSYGTLKYHLRFLKKRRLIITKDFGGFTRYYVTNRICEEDKILFNILRNKKQRTIVLVLMSQNKIGQGNRFRFGLWSVSEMPEIINNRWNPLNRSSHSLNIGRVTIKYHLDKLVKQNMVEPVRVGREIKYQLKDPWRIMEFLITNQDALSYDIINRTVSFWDRISDRGFDNSFEAFYEVFPHPYHV